MDLRIERGFEKDLEDVREMVRRGLVLPARAIELMETILPDIVRFPAIDAESFRRDVRRVLGRGQGADTTPDSLDCLAGSP